VGTGIEWGTTLAENQSNIKTPDQITPKGQYKAICHPAIIGDDSLPADNVSVARNIRQKGSPNEWSMEGNSVVKLLRSAPRRTPCCPFYDY
jgi:hypothetical protein